MTSKFRDVKVDGTINSGGVVVGNTTIAPNSIDTLYAYSYQTSAYYFKVLSGSVYGEGIRFVDDPGGGSGDSATIKYYPSNIEAGATEDTLLELKVTNDENDSIRLNSPNASFTVGKRYNSSPSIQGYTTGQVEFRYAGGDQTRYLRMQTDGNMVIYNAFGTGALWASNTASSDRSIKENIKNYDRSGLDVINKLNVVEFNYIKSHDTDQSTKVGFIAQDVKDLIPQSIKSIGQTKETEILLMYKEELVPFLTKAIQEQQKIIETQQSKIASFEERIKLIEDLLK
jgi:hypothetical protein